MAFDNIRLTDDQTGQEMVVNGGFGSAAGWSGWTATGALTRNFSYSGSTPAGGSGRALLLSGGDGDNGGVYQALTLERGRTYTLDGVFRDVASSTCWAEIFLRTDAPVNGQDYVPGPVIGSGISLQTSTQQQLEDYFDSLDEVAYAVDEDLKYWLTTTNAPSLITPPTVQDWYGFGSIDGWAVSGTEMTEMPPGSNLHRHSGRVLSHRQHRIGRVHRVLRRRGGIADRLELGDRTSARRPEWGRPHPAPRGERRGGDRSFRRDLTRPAGVR